MTWDYLHPSTLRRGSWKGRPLWGSGTPRNCHWVTRVWMGSSQRETGDPLPRQGLGLELEKSLQAEWARSTKWTQEHGLLTLRLTASKPHWGWGSVRSQEMEQEAPGVSGQTGWWQDLIWHAQCSFSSLRRNIFFFFNFLCYTVVELINNVVIASGEQQRDSAIHYMYPFSPQPPSHPGCHATLSRVPCVLQ